MYLSKTSKLLLHWTTFLFHSRSVGIATQLENRKMGLIQPSTVPQYIPMQNIQAEFKLSEISLEL